jgi:hypothetical protein
MLLSSLFKCVCVYFVTIYYSFFFLFFLVCYVIVVVCCVFYYLVFFLLLFRLDLVYLLAFVWLFVCVCVLSFFCLDFCLFSAFSKLFLF